MKNKQKIVDETLKESDERVNLILKKICKITYGKLSNNEGYLLGRNIKKIVIEVISLAIDKAFEIKGKEIKRISDCASEEIVGLHKHINQQKASFIVMLDELPYSEEFKNYAKNCKFTREDVEKEIEVRKRIRKELKSKQEAKKR